MSTRTFDVVSVVAPAVPRGSRIAADLFVAAEHLVERLFHRHHPSRAEEAAAVREMARCVQDSDPGFAADLYGAAARHEAMDDLGDSRMQAFH